MQKAASIIGVGVVFAILLYAAPALAQRVYVSALGDDGNPCSRASPCRTFQHAHDVSSAGGLITILDPGGYGWLTITKAISILNDGAGEAGMVQGGITINAGPSDVINLRGLTLIGNNGGTNAIRFNTGGTLNIENCFIGGFSGDGLSLVPSGSSTFNVSDTIVANVGNNAVVIQTSGTGTTVRGQFTRVQASGSGSGFIFNGANSTGTLNVTITDSTSSKNLYGVSAESLVGQAVTKVMVRNTTVSNNTVDGIFEDGANSTTYLAKSTISGNTTAFSVTNGGTLLSFGDNYIASNGSDGGAITTVSAK